MPKKQFISLALLFVAKSKVSMYYSPYLSISKSSHYVRDVMSLKWTHACMYMYTPSNKNPLAWNCLSPELEVTWRTVAIIIRVVLLSPYLHIRGISLSSTHGWKRRVGNYQKLKLDLAVTIQSLTLSWVEAESLYRSILTVSRRNPGSWTRASSSLRK